MLLIVKPRAYQLQNSECVLVALVMQSACVVLHCHLSPVWLYNILPHSLINGTIFGKSY